MGSRHARYVATAGMVAALYALLSVVFLPISFGVYQVRIAEALTVLPFLTPAAIPGLYVGCLLANVIGGMGWLDILVGPLITLVAALVTRWIAVSFKKTNIALALAPLPPVLFNAIGVSAYLAPLIGVSFWFAVQMIAIGQIGACYVLGVPLLMLLRRRKSLF
ncbi:QueT transporter family protein [candidate division GN15 bacterium]|nr:QueT transporter family protein [candidate division GN15 bacterium]